MRRLRSDDPGHHVVPGGLLLSRPHHEGLGQEDRELEVIGMASLGGPQNGLGGGGVAGIFQGPAEQGEGRGRQLGQGGRPGKVPEGRPARLAGLQQGGPQPAAPWVGVGHSRRGDQPGGQLAAAVFVPQRRPVVDGGRQGQGHAGGSSRDRTPHLFGRLPLEIETRGPERRSVVADGLPEARSVAEFSDPGEPFEQPDVGLILVGLLADLRRQLGDARPGRIVAGVVAELEGALGGVAGRGPLGRVVAGQFGLELEQLDVANGQLEPRGAALAVPCEPGPAETDRQHQDNDRRRQADGQPQPHLFVGRLRLGLDLRQLGLSQLLLNSAVMPGDRRCDRAGVARTIARLRSETSSGQRDQFGLGATLVEALPGPREVGVDGQPL